MHSRNFRNKIPLFATFIAFLIIVMAVYYLYDSSTVSPYTGQSSEYFICSSTCKQYPLDVKHIAVTVSNTGGYSGEIDKPVLEKKCKNTWYSVKSAELSEHDLVTSELLYVLPGKSKTFEIPLEQYHSHLSTGEYRLVFGLHTSDKFFAYEFTLIS